MITSGTIDSTKTLLDLTVWSSTSPFTTHPGPGVNAIFPPTGNTTLIPRWPGAPVAWNIGMGWEFSQWKSVTFEYCAWWYPPSTSPEHFPCSDIWFQPLTSPQPFLHGDINPQPLHNSSSIVISTLNPSSTVISTLNPSTTLPLCFWTWESELGHNKYLKQVQNAKIGRVFYVTFYILRVVRWW